MRWQNLTKNLCPKCNKALYFNEHDDLLYCNDIFCGFMISQYRMETLVTQMNATKMADKMIDNFSELQRMGTEQPSSEERDEDMLDRLGI